MVSIWDGAEVIHTYTRGEALEDGALIDVTKTAQEAGFCIPVAVTAALWADINAIPASKRGLQDWEGRLWDVLWVGRAVAKRASRTCDTVTYQVIMHVGRKSIYYVKMVCGPGDASEPVVTLMRPDED